MLWFRVSERIIGAVLDEAAVVWCCEDDVIVMFVVCGYDQRSLAGNGSSVVTAVCCGSFCARDSSLVFVLVDGERSRPVQALERDIYTSLE